MNSVISGHPKPRDLAAIRAIFCKTCRLSKLFTTPALPAAILDQMHLCEQEWVLEDPLRVTRTLQNTGIIRAGYSSETIR